MATEKLTDIELDSVQLHEAKPRTIDRVHSSMWQEDDIETAMGPLRVSVQGDRNKKALLTYHDIGLNSNTCFGGFFNYTDMQPILRHFCVYHVTAPGQQDGALPLPQGGMRNSESANLLDHVAAGNPTDTPPVTKIVKKKRASISFSGENMAKSFQYPTMDQLAEMLLPVLQYYSIKTFIGFGVGAGANILARFGLAHPDKIDGLCLINCSAGKAGWGEWGFQKWNSWYLKSGNVTAGVEEYLLWHWFGKKTMGENYDLVTTYSDYMKAINPQNLAHFIDSYVKRNDLGIVREISALKKKTVRNFKCPVMLIAGESSPHLDDTIQMNARLDPADSTWMKFECGGMIHEEAPNKLCDAFRLFLQGMGYVPNERKPTGQVPSLSNISLVQSRLSASSNANLLHHHGHSHHGLSHASPELPETVTQQQVVC